MESPSLEEENIIKDVRNFFRLEKLKKETIDTTIKGIRNLFRLEKENKVIKDTILGDIINPFENDKEANFYKTVRVFFFFLSNGLY